MVNKKYVKKLVSDENSVLKDYFSEEYALGQFHAHSKNGSWRSLLAFFIFILAVLSLLPYLTYGIGSIYFTSELIILGIVVLPSGVKRIEEILRFDFNKSLQIKFLLPWLFLIVFNGLYLSSEISIAQEEKEIAEMKKARERLKALAKEKERTDSLNYYLSESNNFSKKKNYRYALNTLEYARNFALSRDNIFIDFLEANIFYESRDYKRAIETFQKANSHSPEVLFKIGQSYRKLGKVHEALFYIKRASDSGLEEAIREYERLNPMIKYVVNYRTYCCDGTFSPSNAKGRGACSHHGGVCNWNKPIYAERRKYDVSSF
ncbi:hypothetical protein LAG90_01000 [Marinilongibacter aquaticus]|uniref:CDC27 family protein n=1 Tax=Marinilongibacter aquaticus TaxID=2975157 RepID=UPI0021BDDED9|nr:CDC27 family protein [Marinilongibacter aquaticus]UBM59234.1 hypothetical protein LAG90_01000 [Marinilongibacter aquaticus]